MNPSPILKVLSTFQKNQVQALLIGGQAAILYGGAEFSRDSDFVVLVTPENLRRIRSALADLQAANIVFPGLSARQLRRGHAVHFRCQAEEVSGLRVDLLARLRGCDGFEALWARRHEVTLPDGAVLPVIGLRDLVRCKKTQRDKDWLMLRRLVENDIHLHGTTPEPGQVEWWLRESREPETLHALARRFPEEARIATETRPLLHRVIAGDTAGLIAELQVEEQHEREADRQYWKPLREELETMRLNRRR